MPVVFAHNPIINEWNFVDSGLVEREIQIVNKF